ncbi:MAG: peptide chain release factor N(5)-glutamine methyltransferase [Desulfococcaceae bacterium]|jgi:release factor glutamine methyltransferase|nr:peptide chain release factor N(5)-glutamine methyltransferase [Desulfococcaceae bacterium]
MQKQTEKGEVPWTIRKILRWTTSWFASRNIENPRASAEILLAFVLDLRRIDLYLRHDQPLTDGERAAFRKVVRRRIQHEPVAYIVGQKDFWSVELCVDPSVLIPRPETERLVETALGLLGKRDEGKICRILEMGTGSGAVIVSLAAEEPANCFFASDLSLAALTTARKNAVRNKVGGKILFFCGSWFAPLAGKDRSAGFDLIISNPPYIPTSEIGNLQPEICRYEPVHALDGGNDGLNEIRNILLGAAEYLNEKGSLLVEIGSGQKDAVLHLAEKSGCYEAIACIKDYGGKDRLVQMQKKSA